LALPSALLARFPTRSRHLVRQSAHGSGSGLPKIATAQMSQLLESRPASADPNAPLAGGAAPDNSSTLSQDGTGRVLRRIVTYERFRGDLRLSCEEFLAASDPDDILDKLADDKVPPSSPSHWVSDWCDKDGVPQHRTSGLDGASLVFDLGLWGYVYHPGDHLLALAFHADRVYKPTWLDAGLRFVWYAAPEYDGFGLTMSLRTGQPALREWIVSTDSLVPLSDHNCHVLSEAVDAGCLQESCRNAWRSRIEGKRDQHD
jgi:hypothetical protein